MKTKWELLKSTALRGFLVLLPLLLLYLLLDEMLGAVVALATPIVDLFPADTFEKLNLPVVVAVALILVASLVLGTVATTGVGHRFGTALERNTLGTLTLYRTLKTLTRNLVQIGESAAVKPALLGEQGAPRDLVFLIEELDDGQGVVLVPRAPTPLVGTIRIVPMNMLELLDVTLGDVTRVLSHWGVGSRELFGKQKSGPT